MISKLYLPSWFELILLIHDLPNNQCYFQNLCRKTTMASSHIRANLNLFRQAGLITKENSSKCKYLRLTESGKELALCLIKIRAILWSKDCLQKESSRRRI